MNPADKLSLLEEQFDEEMRARGFDPSQAENVALPTALAKQYAEIQQLRAEIDSENQETFMSELASRDCVPCRGGVPPLQGEAITKLNEQLNGWEVVNEHHLRKEYKFNDFKETQSFVNRVGDLAEEQWHHPDICFGWGKADITIWTHKIDGLTESDFILAAKIDELLK